MQREEPYLGSNAAGWDLKGFVLRTGSEVLHGCRQFVS